MSSRLSALHTLAGTLLASVAICALGQTDPGRPSYSRMLDIDSLLDAHARTLARRYNLNEEQDLYTQAYLRDKANAFLDKHRDELFDLIDRMVDVKAGGEMSPQELIDWGKRALPLYEEAKTLIIEGNSEWRQILNEDQRKIHDADLQEMYGAFSTTEDQLQRIVSGQMTLDEFRRGPARQVTGPQPQPVRPMPPAAQSQTPANLRPTPGPMGPAGRPTVSNPAGGAVARPMPTPSGTGTSGPHRPGFNHGRPGVTGPGTTAPSSPRGGTDFESQWEAYVREFIQKYQLDDGQTERALSYLKDAQEAGRRVIERTKAEIEQLDKKALAMGDSKAPDKLKELNELSARRTKLLEPINEIFEKQLKPRLEKLPTAKQRQAAEEAGKHPQGNNAPTRGKPGRPWPQRPPPQPPQPQPQPQPQPPEPEPPPPEPQDTGP
jgi:hypothetical protein